MCGFGQGPLAYRSGASSLGNGGFPGFSQSALDQYANMHNMTDYAQKLAQPSWNFGSQQLGTGQKGEQTSSGLAEQNTTPMNTGYNAPMPSWNRGGGMGMGMPQQFRSPFLVGGGSQPNSQNGQAHIAMPMLGRPFHTMPNQYGQQQQPQLAWPGLRQPQPFSQMSQFQQTMPYFQMMQQAFPIWGQFGRLRGGGNGGYGGYGARNYGGGGYQPYGMPNYGAPMPIVNQAW